MGDVTAPADGGGTEGVVKAASDTKKQALADLANAEKIVANSTTDAQKAAQTATDAAAAVEANKKEVARLVEQSAKVAQSIRNASSDFDTKLAVTDHYLYSAIYKCICLSNPSFIFRRL